MKFRAQRELLVAAVASAARAVTMRGATGGTTPAVQLSLRGDSLVVSGSDPELVIDATVGVEGLGDGRATVPARLLLEAVRAGEEDAATMEATEEEVRLVVGRAEFSLPVVRGGDVAPLSSPVQERVALPAATFGDALRQVVRAASADDSRAPQLSGVFFSRTARGLRLAATDSYRLAIRDVENVDVEVAEGGVLVPARALGEVQRLALERSGEDPSATVTVGFGELDASFEVGGVRLVTRLLKGSFPDYERLVPKSFAVEVSVAKDAIVSALRRVRVVARDSKDFATPVRVRVEDGVVELSVVTAESGRVNEDLDALVSGGPLSIAFNPSYLLDGVEAVHAERVRVRVVDTGKPALVTGDDEDYKYLLMPVKVV